MPSSMQEAARGASSPLIEVEDLRVAARTLQGPLELVRGVDFTCRAGEITALIGESGSGKSLTAAALLGLLDAEIYEVQAKRLVVAGLSVPVPSATGLAPVRGVRAGYVMQDPGTALDPTMTVGDQIAELFVLHRGLDWSAARREAVRMLDRVRIPGAAERAHDYPHSFSGGMKQRVVIAGAVALDPALLIADEPTTALDVTVQAEILLLVDELRRTMGMGVLLITHDLGVVYQVAERVLVMYAGRLVEEGGAEAVCTAPHHPYTAGLLASVPDLSRPAEANPAIPGNPPMPGRVGPGCAFAPRCDRAVPVCTSAVPALTPIGAGLARCHVPILESAHG